MVVGAVIAAEVTVHLTAADMNVDYDAALLVVQSSKARQQLQGSGFQDRALYQGRSTTVYYFEQLVVGIANMVDPILYAITVGKITVSNVGTVLYLSPPKLQTQQ